MGGIHTHFMSRSRTLCPAHALYVPLTHFMSRSCPQCSAHEKNAGDLEIGHGSIRYLRNIRQRDIKDILNYDTYKK
jgi:hypothetical protein